MAARPLFRRPVARAPRAAAPRPPRWQNSHRRGDEHDDHRQNTKIRQNRVAGVRPEAADRAARRRRADRRRARGGGPGRLQLQHEQQRRHRALIPAPAARSRSLVVADLAPFSGTGRRPRPDLPGVLRRRDPGHQQRRRRARPQAHLQGRGHPGRPRGRGARHPADVRHHVQPRPGHRRHLRRGGERGPGHQRGARWSCSG